MDRPEFELRPIEAADAAAAAALIRAAFAGIVPALVPQPSALAETTESVAVAVGGCVACAGGAVVGVVLWEERDGGLYLRRLAVDPAFRGLRVATALVAEGCAFASASGFAWVHVGVRLVLAGNRRLFASCGFHETSLHAHAGFDAPTWVAMEKRL